MKILKNLYFWLLLSIVISIILGILTRIIETDGLYIATMISCIPWVLFIIIDILFVLIINPIGRLIEKIKNRRA